MVSLRHCLCRLRFNLYIFISVVFNTPSCPVYPLCTLTVFKSNTQYNEVYPSAVKQTLTLILKRSLMATRIAKVEAGSRGRHKHSPYWWAKLTSRQHGIKTPTTPAGGGRKRERGRDRVIFTHTYITIYIYNAVTLYSYIYLFGSITSALFVFVFISKKLFISQLISNIFTYLLE